MRYHFQNLQVFSNFYFNFSSSLIFKNFHFIQLYAADINLSLSIRLSLLICSFVFPFIFTSAFLRLMENLIIFLYFHMSNSINVLTTSQAKALSLSKNALLYLPVKWQWSFTSLYKFYLYDWILFHIYNIFYNFSMTQILLLLMVTSLYVQYCLFSMKYHSLHKKIYSNDLYLLKDFVHFWSYYSYI